MTSRKSPETMARPAKSSAIRTGIARAAALPIVIGLAISIIAPLGLHAQATADAGPAQAMPPDSPPPAGEVTAPGSDITKLGAPANRPHARKSQADESADANPTSGPGSMAPAAAAAKPESTPAGNAFMPFGSTQKGPVNIQSDGLDLDYKNNWVLFHGHVHAVQAGGVLTSDTLRVKYGKDFSQVQQMVADGNVRITQGTRYTTSDHAVLDQDVHTVTLTGNPVVHDGDDKVVGQKIVFNMITGKSEVTGGAKAWFFPRDSKSPNNSPTTVGKAD